LLDPGFLQKEVRGRRGLGYEGECPIGEDRYHAGDNHPALALSPRVELLHELHDVDTMGAQRGADRRGRRGRPRGALQLDHGIDLLGHPISLASTLRVTPTESRVVSGVRRSVGQAVEVSKETSTVRPTDHPSSALSTANSPARQPLDGRRDSPKPGPFPYRPAPLPPCH